LTAFAGFATLGPLTNQVVKKESLMSRSLICALMGTALILTPGIAFAAHGKAGLWTVTSQMEMKGMPQMPPEAMAMMKARGMPMPGAPFTTQMCMTQEQVNADKPPAFSNREESCDTKVLTQSPGAMSAQMTCHGRVEGVGHMEMSWRGNEHYEGTYNFKGTAEGRPQDMTTHYSGDFVKADCGSVKPYGRPAGAMSGPPPGR
jgi:hypothetical protein